MLFAKYLLNHFEVPLIYNHLSYHIEVASLHNNYYRMGMMIKLVDNHNHFMNILSFKD